MNSITNILTFKRIKLALFLLLMLCLVINKAFSQQYMAVSHNSRIMILGYDEKKTKETDSSHYYKTGTNNKKITHFNFRFDTYDLTKFEKIFSFRISLESNSKIDTLFLSHDGRNLVLVFGNRNIVCNTQNGKILGDYDQLRHIATSSKKAQKIYKNEKNLAFSNFDNQYLLATESKLKAFSSLDGKEFFEYSGVPAFSRINELYFTPDDKYIILKDHKSYIYIWKTGKRELIKKMLGNEISYSSDLKTIVLTRKTTTTVTTYYFSLPTMSRLNRISSAKVLRNLKSNGQKITPELASISSKGSYTLFVTSGETVSNYYIFSNNSSELTMTINLDYKKQKLLATSFDYELDKTTDRYSWLNDSLLIFPINNSESILINVKAGRLVDVYNYAFEFNASEYNIPKQKQANERVFSYDKKIVALPYRNFLNKGVYFKTSTIKQPKSSVIDAELIYFTPNSKIILLKDNNNRIAYLKSANIYADFGDMPMTLQYFSDTITSITEIRLDDKGKIPADYSYTRLLESMPISDLRNDLNIKLKTITESDSFIEIQVHLIDDNGVYYFGAGQEEWIKTWCNLVIIGPDGNKLQSDDFQIIEHNKNDSLTNAISIVLDHSGSMGDDRAVVLQKGTTNFIQSKDVADAFSILRFDHAVRIDVPLKQNKDELMRYFKINGLTGMGGGTALIDAISVGISTIKDSRNYDRKSLIVFTDGNENSSFGTKREMLIRALENNIQINTIGYGDDISDEYLQTIADFTGGSYFNLYETRQLDWIFEDIYQKNQNYYGIRVKANEEGNYRFFIKICPPKGDADTLMLSYNFQPQLLKKIKAEENFIFEPLAKKITISEFDSNKLIYNDITNFDKIKIVKSEKTDTLEIIDKSTDLSLIEDEFEKLIFPDIKFVFDKTDIVQGTDKELKNVIQFLKKYPEIIIEISGHTDEKGSNEYNQKLSERRAEKVKQLIVNQGISPLRIRTTGLGESKFIKDNKTDYGRQENRRVEFRILE